MASYPYGLWSRRAVRWTLRWFSRRPDHARQDHFSCDRDGILPTCTHVAQPVCPQVPCGVHTNTATSIFGLAQLSTWEDRKQVRYEGDIDSAFLTQRAVCKHILRKCDCG